VSGLELPNLIKARVGFGLLLLENGLLRMENAFLLAPSFSTERNRILQVGVPINLANVTQIWFGHKMSDTLDELVKFEEVQERERFESIHDEFPYLFAQHADLKHRLSRQERCSTLLDHGKMLHQSVVFGTAVIGADEVLEFLYFRELVHEVYHHIFHENGGLINQDGFERPLYALAI